MMYENDLYDKMSKNKQPINIIKIHPNPKQ